MKVLVVGFPKTGTKTMGAALGILGYTVYDYDSNFYYLGKDWLRIFEQGGTKKDFYRMYKDVDATMDTPTVMFWEEILDAFPDTKAGSAGFNVDSVSFAENVMKGRVMYSAPNQRPFRVLENMSPNIAKRRYRDHNTGVLTRAPKGQLLQYELCEGWEPLCKFLGKPIPDVPFPHKNKKGSILDDYLKHSPVFQRMKLETMISCGTLCATLALSLYYILQ